MTTNQSSSRNKVGELRPSQILFSSGIGSVVDLPNLSTMVMGLDDWDITHASELGEERLLAAVRRELGNQVKKLLTPPVASESSSTILDESVKIGIPVSPFPTWALCPQCRLLAPLKSGLFQLKTDRYRPDQNRYVHSNCPKGKYPPTVIPARFLVACQHGHLDDFPWHYFVHKGNSNCKGSLRLYEYGVSGSATDIEVKCDTCNASRRMSDAFGELGKKNMPQCRGRNPHLRSFDEDGCTQQMKSILLGASNSWFPITLSVLSIPTTINQLGQLVEKHWMVLEKAIAIEILAAFRQIGQLKEFAKYSDTEIWQEIEGKRKGTNEADPIDVKDIKTPEWQVFSQANTNLNNADFWLTPVAAPKNYESYFEKVVLVERLREVRALVGFTRIESPGDYAETGELPEEYWASLSRSVPKWVPASEVRGEGIFIQFREQAIQHWLSSTPRLKTYDQQSLEAHRLWRRARSLEPLDANYPGVRYILLHSFAHALMRQLAIECGYTAASLRERIYSKYPNEDNGPMAGVLLYTAAPDSEGTLGGLVSLGEPNTLGRHIDQALEQMRLCASDPLCAEHTPLQNTTSLHWAACHACLFSPETSCERGNKYLDRTLLIPTMKSDLNELAFFKFN
ncbi:hypothetical protein NIES2119_24195 [[Phormidium ambiguum] IAM M-71]|uniref:MrfA-like Zn-binding domain-containing protein n=1 Tax=[Phormidium ambiguum] IAM M-71 TaxID=454136 RepID=A0A1U7I9P6_9CYAN|nr:DUF1998 domain-containing protein [Phormidium ambiguum]OKH33163.1 hypothetical protein NIES2119_24195 [Phormidium ambiguum IAM M-71]